MSSGSDGESSPDQFYHIFDWETVVPPSCWGRECHLTKIEPALLETLKRGLRELDLGPDHPKKNLKHNPKP